jgi:hypothetical protein
MLLFTQPGTAQQTIQLHLSDDGEYWTGVSATLRDLSPNQRKDPLYLSRRLHSARRYICLPPSAADKHAHSNGRP